jgi:uncharacterized protein (TIGR03437 family)
MTARYSSQWAYLTIVCFLSASEFVLNGQSISFLRFNDVPIPLGSPIPGGGTSPQLVTSGDFNGDGKIDLALSTGSNLLLFLGNGDGTFKRIDLGFSATLTLVADVNRDGKADLLFMSGGQVFPDPGQAFVLLGNGDGTFQPVKVLPAFPLVVADLNRDGIPDLLVASQFGRCAEDSFSVYLGKGDGTFQSPLPCSPGSTRQGDWGTRTIAVADIDNDGMLDAIWGNVRSTNLLYWWKGNGDGTFQAPVGIPAGTNQGGKPLAIGDLNHDGKLDIVVGDILGVSILLGNGDGTFQSTSSAILFGFDAILGFQVPRDWIYGNDIFLRDFDGDGNLDIIIDEVMFCGNGDGTFQSAQFLRAGSTGAISVVCADLNGDGKPDLVYVDQLENFLGTASKLAILLNNSPNAVLGYSAATGGSLLAPGSIGSIYGKDLAKTTASAKGASFPTQLGGISLRVRDDTDSVRLAPLIFVSSGLINFVVPSDTAVGPVTLTIDDGAQPLFEGANATIVNPVAAGFFTANANGQGVAAATAVRILADRTQQPVTVFTCASAGHCSPVPIDMTSGLPVYLSLYGTGFGNEYLKLGPTNAAAAPNCQVGGKNAAVQYAGPETVYPGLDQLNLLLPNSLSSGIVSIQCGFAGSDVGNVSNVVQIAIK